MARAFRNVEPNHGTACGFPAVGQDPHCAAPTDESGSRAAGSWRWPFPGTALHSPMIRRDVSVWSLLVGCLLMGFVRAEPLISEFAASNQLGLRDEDGDRNDWIEIFNAGTGAVNLAGWHLTDDALNKTKWTFPAVTIPAQGYLLVWASDKNKTAGSLHTNFRLSAEGEYLALIRPDLTVAQEFVPAYPPQPRDVSYGVPMLLLPDESGVVVDLSRPVYFLEPTPAALNGAGAENIGPLITEVSDSPAVAAGQAIVVKATVSPTLHPVAGARLHYRVNFGPETEVPMFDDGVHEDGLAEDGVYAATIPADAGGAGDMLRWRIGAVDRENQASTSPSFPDPLNSPEYWGTVRAVPNPVPGGQLPVFHWFIERPTAANNPTGTRCSFMYQGQFFDNVGVNLHGQGSRSFPKKSYDFDLNTSYKLRWEAALPSINSFNLLTTYTDKSYLRNLLAYELIREAGVEGHWAFAVQVRQNNAFHSVAHLVEDGDQDYLERGATLDERGALYKMYNDLSNPDPPGAEKKSRKTEGHEDLAAFVTGLAQRGVAREQFIYDQAGIPETVNFLVAQTLTGNVDYGHKNYYIYRDSEGNREWRLLPWDVDLSFGRVWSRGPSYYDDTLYADTSIYIIKGNRFIAPFLDNSLPTLRQMYLRRLRTLADTVLQAESVPRSQRWLESRIDYWKKRIEPEVLFEQSQTPWGSWGVPQTLDEAVALLADSYLPARRAFIFSHPDLPPAQSPTVTVELGALDFDPASGNEEEEYFTLVNPNAVAVDVSGWTVEGAVTHRLKPGTVIPAEGTLYLSPNVSAFRERAVSPRGGERRFVQGNYGGRLARGQMLTLRDGSRVVATQTYAGALPSLAQRHLRLTELMYHPAARDHDAFDSGEYEYLELRNTGTVPLNLEGVKFSQGIDFTFDRRTLEPESSIVLARNAGAFAERYPGVEMAGTYRGALDNAGERLQLLDDQGEVILDFTYSDAWYPETDGQGYSLEVVDELAHPSAWAGKAQWRPSTAVHGTPGRAADSWSMGITTYRAETGMVGSFSGRAGQTYTVQYADTLGPANWRKLSDHLPVTNGPVEFIDADATSLPHRFYRVVSPQLP